MDRSVAVAALLCSVAGATGCGTTKEVYKPCECPEPKVEIREKVVEHPVYCVKGSEIQPLPPLRVSALAPEDESDPGKVAEAWAQDVTTLMKLAQEQRNQLSACVDPDEGKKPSR